MNFIASAPQGLEEVLAKEVCELGAEDIEAHKRFVSFKCDISVFFKLHFFARVPFRVYREVANFDFYDRKTLYEGVQKSFDWLSWLPPEKSFYVTVSGNSRVLRHSHFTALEVKNSIVDLQKLAWGQRSSITNDNPFLVIHLHLNDKKAIISLPTTINSLHKRGYRPAIGCAPLKENIAAGLLKLTDWDGKKTLIDIMCGSGTFLIEGVSQALNIPLQVQKKYLFENWLDFDQELFSQEKSKLNHNLLNLDSCVKVFGCELNKEVFNQAQENILRARMKNYIELHNDDFSKLVINQPKGIIICNPPYGKRLGDESQLVDLYGKIGEFLKKKCSGWDFWLLSGNPSLTKFLKMKASQKIPVSNGGIDCRWIKYLIR